jgi:hypothetical protein
MSWQGAVRRNAMSSGLRRRATFRANSSSSFAALIAAASRGRPGASGSVLGSAPLGQACFTPLVEGSPTSFARRGGPLAFALTYPGDEPHHDTSVGRPLLKRVRTPLTIDVRKHQERPAKARGPTHDRASKRPFEADDHKLSFLDRGISPCRVIFAARAGRSELVVACRGVSGVTSVRDVVVHEIKVRDMRLRYGAPEVFAAQCSCGWIGEERRGRSGERAALMDGSRHCESFHPSQASGCTRPLGALSA